MKVANVNAIYTKICQLNSDGSLVAPELQLDANELMDLANIVSLISTEKLDKASDESWIILYRLAFKWDDQSRYPGLDLLRLAIAYISPRDLSLVSSLLGCINKAPVSKHSENNTMLAVRCLVNMFSHANTRQLLWNDRKLIMERVFKTQSASGAKNLHIAVGTLMMNFSVLSAQLATDYEFCGGLFGNACGALRDFCDSDSVFRVLICAGNLVLVNPSFGARIKTHFENLSLRFGDHADCRDVISDLKYLVEK